MMTSLSDLFVSLNSEGAGDPLYCVHPVSGSAYSYSGLARSLGRTRPVIGIEAPGFDTDRAPVESVSELSKEYLKALQPGRPHLLLGWSMGGVIAFDMAWRLAAAGERVSSLILIDTPVPSPAERPTEKAMLDRFLQDIAGASGVEGMFDAISAELPEDVEPARFVAALAESGGLSEDIDNDFLLKKYAVFRAHVLALAKYRVTDSFPGKITHLRAAESPATGMDWQAQARDVEQHVVPGTHYTMWSASNLPAITSIVQETLSRTS
ncbi:MAG: alpha/beta fold hydrolase [Jatrophihabitantaceae bacterium]